MVFHQHLCYENRPLLSRNMAGIYHLKYRDGRAEVLCNGEGYYYVLGPDTLIHFSPIPAWCHHCKIISLVEDLKQPEDIREELRQIEDPESPWYRNRKYRIDEHFISVNKEHLKNQLTLWNQRTSPPRCVVCGTTAVGFFEHRKWAPHPGTGEEVFFSLDGVGSVSCDRIRYFNTDGVELALTDAEREHYRTLRRENKALRC